MSNVWEAVFYFEGWREWVVGPHPLLPHGANLPTLNANFISSENYRDTLFCASSLTLTVFLHEVYFSGLPFDPSKLGSNGCEHYFGTLRTFVRNRNSFCLYEMLNTLTRVVGEIVAREEGAVAYPRQNARHTSRASRHTMQAELARIRKQVQGINQTPTNSGTTEADPVVIADAIECVLKVAEIKAARSLAACGIRYHTAGESSIAFRLPAATAEAVRSRRQRAEDEDHLADDATSPGWRAHDTEGELSTEDYLCEIHESWLTCWLDADVDGAMSHLERASETLQGLSPNELFCNSICDMAINPDGEGATTTATTATTTAATATAAMATTTTAPCAATTAALTTGGPATTTITTTAGASDAALTTAAVTETRPTATIANAAIGQTAASIAQESSPLMVLHNGEWTHLGKCVADHDGRVQMGALNRKERFFVSCRDYFVYEAGPAPERSLDKVAVYVNDYVTVWHGGKLTDSTYVAGDFVLGRVESIWLKPTTKSAFPKSFWLVHMSGDVHLRLKILQPEDESGSPCTFKAAKQFGWRQTDTALSKDGSRAFLNVRLHTSWIHAGRNGEIGSAVKVAAVQGDPNAVSLVTQPGMATRRACEGREKEGLQKQARDKAEAVAAAATRRRAGPVEAMQKGDLVAEIKKVYSELPSSWASFKKPELTALLTEMFERHKELHLHNTRGGADRESTMQQLMHTAVQTVASALNGVPSTAFKAASRAALTFLAVPADANGLLDNDQEPTLTAALDQVVVQWMDWTAHMALQVWFIPIIEAHTQALLLDTASLLAAALALGVVLLCPRLVCFTSDGQAKHVFVLVHNGIVLGLLWWLNSLLGVSLSPRWDALLLLMVHLLVAWAGQGRVGPRATLVGWNLTKLVLGAEELHTSAMLCMALATACGRAAAAWFLRQVAWWLLAPMLRTRAECYMPATRPLHARYTPAICMAR